MTKTIEAIFEDSVFKPITPLNLSEHKKVTLVIKENCEETPYILSLAATVYEDLSQSNIEDIENVALDRNRF